MLQKRLFLLPATREDLPQLNLVEQCHDARVLGEDFVLLTYRKLHNVSHLGFGTPPEWVVHNPLLLQRDSEHCVLRLWTTKRDPPGTVLSQVNSEHHANLKIDAEPKAVKPTYLKMLLFQPPPDELKFGAHTKDRFSFPDVTIPGWLRPYYHLNGRLVMESFLASAEDAMVKDLLDVKVRPTVTEERPTVTEVIVYERQGKQTNVVPTLHAKLMPIEELQEHGLVMSKMHKSRQLVYNKRGDWELPL